MILDVVEVKGSKHWWELITIHPDTTITQKRLSNAMWESILLSARRYEFIANTAFKDKNMVASKIQISYLTALTDIASKLHAMRILDQRFNRNFKELHEIDTRMRTNYDITFNIEKFRYPE